MHLELARLFRLSRIAVTIAETVEILHACDDKTIEIQILGFL